MEEWIIGSLNCWIDDPLAGPLFAEAIKAGPGGDAVGDHELIADQIGRPDELSPKAGCVERGSCFQDKPMGVRRPGKDKIAAAPGDAQCWRASDLILSWPTNAHRFVLETTPTLNTTSLWTQFIRPPYLIGDHFWVTNAIAAGT